MTVLHRPAGGPSGGGVGVAAGSGALPPVLRERVRGEPVPGDPITTFLREAPGSTEMCISDSGNQCREKEVFLNFSSRKINAQEGQTGKNVEFGVGRFGFPPWATPGTSERLRASVFSSIKWEYGSHP